MCSTDSILRSSRLILSTAPSNWRLTDDTSCLTSFNSRLVSFTKNSMLLVPFSAFVRRREISSEMGSGCNEEKVADCGNWSLWVETLFSIDTSLIELSSSFCRKSVCSRTTVSMLDMALAMVISDRLIH